MKRVLDVCCGSRMFWFDKQNKDVLFVDKRKEVLTAKDREKIISDFKNQEFKVGNKVYKVKNDDNYTFKFLKKTLKCAGGLERFYRFIIREMYDQLFSSLVYTLKKAGELMEEV